MPEPVFVLHGVANRDEFAFRATVATLEAALVRRLDATVELVPVYWGDLGARGAHLDAVIPGRARRARGGTATTGPDPLVAQVLAATTSSPRGLDAPGIVATAASFPGRGGRRARSLAPDPGLETAVRETWPTLTNLPLVRDEALLTAVGNLLAAPPGVGLADVSDPALESARGTGVLAAWVRDRLHDVDALVGQLAGNAAGSVNAMLRGAASPSVAHFLGDVLVYQRRWGVIRDRVRETVARWAREHVPDGPVPGTADAPVRLLGHSLGGVIAADLAVADQQPLHTSLLVTFGSQWPLFHLMDPRGVPAFEGARVPLPGTLGRWVNLWEPLDPLAFLAGAAFELPDGGPQDVEVPHLASTGWWTHSAYWELDVVADVIAENLARR